LQTRRNVSNRRHIRNLMDSRSDASNSRDVRDIIGPSNAPSTLWTSNSSREASNSRGVRKRSDASNSRNKEHHGQATVARDASNSKGVSNRRDTMQQQQTFQEHHGTSSSRDTSNSRDVSNRDVTWIMAVGICTATFERGMKSPNILACISTFHRRILVKYFTS
jgi:hypothetical protein